MPPLAALPIADTPVAILDFETTGLRPGSDRVVEVAVIRLNPGRPPRLVLETLVNPRRPMACTEIHGITDADVADAPEFGEIVPALLAALGGCAMAAYNVYFDLKFLEYELNRAGAGETPPHLCLMHLRPMLGLGNRCSLDDACREHGIRQHGSHFAAADVMAEAQLYRFYQAVCHDLGVETFGDLAERRSYKFCDSFEREPLLYRVNKTLPRLKSRRTPTATPPLFKGGPGGVARQRGDERELKGDSANGVASLSSTVHPRSSSFPPLATLSRPHSAAKPLRQYWDALKLVLSDLEISDGELEYIERKKRELALTNDEIRLQHARAFASVISQFADDQRLDDHECRKLNRLHRALARLGWAPGQ